MTMHIGYERGGRWGLITAGAMFILPAATITLILAWLYTNYGTLPQIQPIFWGIKPVVLAIILSAVWKLGQKALKNWALALLGAVVLASVLLGADEVLVLLIGGTLGMLFVGVYRYWRGLPILILWPGMFHLNPQNGETGQAVSLIELGLFFLKVGATLYGSGYVLVAYLQGGLVERLGWLSQEQLLDAIAVGQLSPGPVLTTATFVGYLVAGLPGGIIATLAIFLPSFIFVLILNPLIPKMRRSKWLSAFLDAVNVSAVALMTAVLFLLGRSTLDSWPSVVITLAAVVSIFRFKVSAIWLIIGGAGLGYVFYILGLI
jgi:chromate transporter